MQKNVQFEVYFDCVTAAGVADVSTVPTVERSLDGGNYAATTNSATRIQSTHTFKLTLTAAEMNTSCTIVKVTGAGLLPRVMYLYPEATWLSSVATLIDAAVSTRLAAAGYTAPDNASVAAIKTKTDNLPASPAAVGSAMTLTSDYDNAKTAWSTLTAQQVWEYATRTVSSFGSLIADIWSAIPFTYVAPDNVKIASIEGKTSQLVFQDNKVNANADAVIPEETITDIVDQVVIGVQGGGSGKVLLADTVEYPGGTPLVGATVTLCTDSEGLEPGPVDMTDDLGYYQFYVVPGEYWVNIQHPRYLSQLVYKDMRGA